MGHQLINYFIIYIIMAKTGWNLYKKASEEGTTAAA